MLKYRKNVGIVLINGASKVFWAQRIKDNYWQFPQGGIESGEDEQAALFRELHEEVGLNSEDVAIVDETSHWHYYDFPVQRMKDGELISGQKQKWFLLKLESDCNKINFDATQSPEFKNWKWVDYWYPLQEIVAFKRKVYEEVLLEFRTHVFTS